MPMNTSVKFFHSGMAGAPQISGAKGSLIALLDACLVDGWALSALDGLTVAAGQATATLAAGHPFLPWQVVRIEGATPAELNGEHRITAVTTTTVSFEVSGVADGTASGTITMRIAPLGWTKPFSGSNKAAYQIDAGKHPDTTGCLVRFDDNGSYGAQVTGYESMTDVDDGSAPFPSAGQHTNGLWTLRSESTSTTSYRSWFLVGDSRFVYLGINHYSTSTISYGPSWTGFGEFKSTKSADPFRFVVAPNYPGDSAPTTDQSYSVASTRDNLQYLARAHDGLGGGVRCMNRTWPTTYGGSGGGGAPLPYPNGPDYGLYLCKAQIFEYSPPQYRGDWPGMYLIPHQATNRICPDKSTPYFDLEVPGFEGRVVGFLPCAYSGGNWGVVAFDLTGPWEH